MDIFKILSIQLSYSSHGQKPTRNQQQQRAREQRAARAGFPLSAPRPLATGVFCFRWEVAENTHARLPLSHPTGPSTWNGNAWQSSAQRPQEGPLRDGVLASDPWDPGHWVWNS